MGQYAFVGAVNKAMNTVYKDYCDSVENPPLVRIGHTGHQATSTSTFYSAAFCNVACAEYWNSDTSRGGKSPSRVSVCQAIAKVGSPSCS